MQKKCIICEENKAVLCVKGMVNDCYCQDCAQENFADLSYLTSLDEENDSSKSQDK